MLFFRNLLIRFARFMSVRNGPDQLGMALLVFSFVLHLIMAFTGLYWLIYVSLLPEANRQYCEPRMRLLRIPRYRPV